MVSVCVSVRPSRCQFSFTALSSLPHYTALPPLPHYTALPPLPHYTALPPLPHYTVVPSLPHYTALPFPSYYTALPRTPLHRLTDSTAPLRTTGSTALQLQRIVLRWKTLNHNHLPHSSTRHELLEKVNGSFGIAGATLNYSSCTFSQKVARGGFDPPTFRL